MLKIENLQFSYQRKGEPLFSDFSLELPAGKVHGLLGRNGAGKSTLIYLMSGLLTPDGGGVFINGDNVRDRRPATLSDVMLVPEEFDLPDLTLQRYIDVTAPFYPRFDRDLMERYLDIFEVSHDIHLKHLSMGQKKKVQLSLALAAGTHMLLLDEPTNGLDIPGKSQFRKAITLGMNDDRTIIISTHQVRDVDTILDHVTIVDHSRVLLSAGTDEIGQRLAFVEAYDPQTALAVQATPGGYRMVAPNTDGRETVIDMELLFNAVLTYPEKITNLFNTPA